MNIIPAPHHRLPLGSYSDAATTSGPDVAHLNKLRDLLMGEIMNQGRHAGRYMEDALGAWAQALDDMPDLEIAAQDDRECV